ncbi:MAG: site-specific DNA-methyltransferase [Desulfobulbus sp.]
MKIEQLRPLEINGYKANARTHSTDQVAQIAASIREFGFNQPILIDETSTIIAGHGRLAAADILGLQTVPCIRLSHLDEKQRRAYIIADNKIASNAGWNMSLLQSELAELSGLIDMTLLGFSGRELLELLPLDPSEGLTDPDAVPPVPDNPQTIPGDIWVLGRHRLMCGDSTNVGDWMRLCGGTGALQWFWTDPPYNVNYGDKARSLNKIQKGHRNCDKILNDHMATDEFYRFLFSMFTAVHEMLEPGAAIYVAHAETERANFTLAFEKAGFKLSSNIIWRKNQLVLGRSDYQYMHEPILYGWKTGAGHFWCGGRKKTTMVDLADGAGISRTDSGNYVLAIGDDVIEIDKGAVVEVTPSTVLSVDKPKRNDVHPTMKPVELVERCLKCSAKNGATGGDAFGGSGTTLIAAERLGLSSRVMELAPKYCDVIVRRWAEYTGLQAVNETTGESFKV